jgi:hypothetical protein
MIWQSVSSCREADYKGQVTRSPFSGLILPAELKQSIFGLGEAEFPKRRAAGFTLLAGWCLTSNLRLGDHPGVFPWLAPKERARTWGKLVAGLVIEK